MTTGFGFLALHAQPIRTQPEVAQQIANLLADPRWPWPLNLVRPTPLPGAAGYPWPSGKVPHAIFAKTAADILRSDRTLGIHAVASRTDDNNHVFAHVDGGHADYTGRPDGTAFPFEARLFCRAHESLDRWIELVHELVVLLDAPHAVIFARPDERHVWSLLYGTGSTRSDQPADHPHNVNARIAGQRRMLGASAIRPPEWGTYLAPAHVEKIGRDKLVAAAAVARDVGKLLFLACSSSADALGAEANERRQALAALLAPIAI